MSDLTVDLEYGSTSASPLLPITFSPENENMTAPQPTFEILTAPQSLSPNLEPLSSYEHGSTSALPEIQMAETIPLTTPQYQFQYGHGTVNLLPIETRENYINYGVPFYQAAIRGDWGLAKGIIATHPEIVRARITSKSETGLHIAAATKNLSFVRMLVEIMTPVDIRMISNSKNTALCYAAVSGMVDIAKVMVEKVKDLRLPLVRGKGGMTPLHMAAELGHRDMVNYLLPLTDVNNELTTDEVMELFISLIDTNLYDVALKILEKYPTLATARDKRKETALNVLARKPLSSKVDLDRGHWKGLITSGFSIYDGIYYHKNNKALKLVSNLWKYVVQTSDDIKISNLVTVPTQLLFVATKSGNVEFITILITYYPDLIWNVDHENRSMFHVAVYERQENIFRIIYEIGAIKDLILVRNDSKNNNMLHMAAKLAPSNRLDIVSGAALQLQRELMWFKEVEKIVLPSDIETKNNEGFTPKELFDKDHKRLRKAGEKWMKSTVQSYMIVSTLIASVMFAAAFNLPGGRMADGTPNYLKNPWFLTFVIADYLSLFSSVATILHFLPVFTSRYKEEDFLHTLPSKLLLGLLTLYVSMVMMMIALIASMFIIFQGKLIPVAYAISCAAVIPVISFFISGYSLTFSSQHTILNLFQSRGLSLLGLDLKTRRNDYIEISEQS